MVQKLRIENIPVASILMRSRVRTVSMDAVEVLRQSHADLGEFTTPIHVRKLRDGQYELIDGAHRLTLARDLELDVIPARIWECSQEQARFFETDANVSISHLTPVALARSLAVRQEAYVKLHPETAGGVAGGKARQGQQTTISSFAEFTAANMGYSQREIQRLIRAGHALTDQQAEALEKSSRRITKNDLAEVAKIGEQDKRSQVVELLAGGEVKSAKDALKSISAEKGEGPAPLNPTDKAWLRLRDAWLRAPKAARKIFFEEHGEEIRAALDEFGGQDD